MKIINQLIMLFSVVILYFILKEFLMLYNLFYNVHPILGYVAIALIFVFVIYFILIPLITIFKIPKYEGPVFLPEKVEPFIKRRMDQFKKNPHLIRNNFSFEGLEANKEGYDRVIKQFKVESEKIRRKYVSQLFYSTSVVQNGFLDAILILTASIHMIKEIFTLYNGRVSNRDLLKIGKKIYYSMLVGGSEGVEYVSQDLISRLTGDSIKSVPFVDKILGSLADGFVNAAMLTRIALITENYCTLVYIKSDRELYPSMEFISETTKQITSDITDRLKITLNKIATNQMDKAVDFARLAINPAAYVVQESVNLVSSTAKKMGTESASFFKESWEIVMSPIDNVINYVSTLLMEPEKYDNADQYLNKN